MMNTTDDTDADHLVASSVAASIASNLCKPIPVPGIIGALLLTPVSILGMSMLIWFIRRYCCACFKRGSNHDTEIEVQDYDNDHGTDHSNRDTIEEDRLREVRSDSCNDTASTIPSVITISRRSIATRDRRWYRRSRIQDGHSHTSATRNETKEPVAVPSTIGRRFLRSGGNRDQQRRRRRQRRQRRDRISFGLLHRSPTTSRADSIRPSSTVNYNSFLDHLTNLTSSCDDMSLPEEGLAIDFDVDVADAAHKRNDTATNNNNNNNNDHLLVDPPGARLDGGTTDDSEMDFESYPNAIIQFRNPINVDSSDDCGFFDGEEIDHLIDFLRHTEEYVRYPRCRLTILLRARVPETDDDRDELRHLRAIIADASASSPSSSPVSATSIPSGNGEFSEGQQQQVRTPPLQVDITTVSSGEDPLRCAPTGGFLVTFGSVWELPRDHPDFLKDLVV